jgi:hypothetical protein
LIPADRIVIKHGYSRRSRPPTIGLACSPSGGLACGFQTDTSVLAAGFALFDAGLQPTLRTDLIVGSSLDRSGRWGRICGAAISAGPSTAAVRR